jgi:hypothetical protein
MLGGVGGRLRTRGEGLTHSARAGVEVVSSLEDAIISGSQMIES